jgi:oxygen-independent coproporphyrinogen-3 oxidase
MKILPQSIITKYDRQVPRYTSYPPATQFREASGEALYTSWLEKAQGDVSLYIHIPFCMKLCYYCGCNMRVVNSYDPIAAYLETLKKELSLLAERLDSTVRLTHIHFGGGSPTSIRPSDFKSLMGFIHARFTVSQTAEIGIEADPRNMSEGRIATYAGCGVNRISLGVQDFDEKVLEAINRRQPFFLTYDALELCRSYGIKNINFDLMYGLPHQTQETMINTIENAVLMRPSRIAFFGYAHVPWMKRHMNMIPSDSLPGRSLRYDLYTAGADILEKAGYCPVGIDHFVLPEDAMKKALDEGTLRRNFQGYTTDTASALIGAGVSSIGAFADGYIQNRTDIKLYHETVSKGSFAVAKVLEYKDADLVFKHVIEQIMCYLQVDLGTVEKNFNLSDGYFSPCLDALGSLLDDGIVSISGKAVTVSPEARVLARVVCQAFDCYADRDGCSNRHAAAV